MPVNLSPAGSGRLRGLCGGAVHLPGDPGYQAACTPLQRPGEPAEPVAVLYPGDEPEVVEALLTVRALGLRVLVQRTGLGPRPAGSLRDVVLLRTSGLGGVRPELTPGGSVDGRVIRARAGALCADVAAAAAGAGLALVTGDPVHGVVGGTVLGPPDAAAAIGGARAVLADGSVVTADQDLLGALRSGILPAAVITELTLGRPLPFPAPQPVAPGPLDPTGLFLLPAP